MVKYSKPVTEVVEFTAEEVVMNLVGSSEVNQPPTITPPPPPPPPPPAPTEPEDNGED